MGVSHLPHIFGYLCNSISHLAYICVPEAVQGQGHRDEQNTDSFLEELRICWKKNKSTDDIDTRLLILGIENKHTGQCDSRSFGLRQPVINYCFLFTSYMTA